MDNPNDSDHNESNAQMHEVFLRRYTLTYSAYFPPLFRSWICLCENVVPTSWLSHYTLIVGNYYFDLERKGSRPFASTAKFHGRKSSNEVEHLSDKDKWRPVDEWLGTTAISPDTIETKLEAQDQLFREKNTGAQNCLLDDFREYSLLNSNCQHFVLELTRRINVHFVSNDVEEKIVRDSTRPRIVCGVLLFTFGFILSLLMCMPSGFLSRTIVYLTGVGFHVAYAMSIIQDTRACKQRLDRLENECRYLQTRNYRDMTWMKPKWVRVFPKTNNYLLSWLYQHYLLASLQGSFYGVFVGLYFLLHLDAWRAVKVVTATIISYPIMIGVPAYHILAFLKSKNEVNQLLEDDEQKRIDAAYNFITTHMTCHCCNRNHWLCIFRQIVHHPTKGLEPLADFVDQEVYEEPFGREDLGRAINRFEKERTGNTFMSWMYLVQLIMSDMRREGNPALDYMREW